MTDFLLPEDFQTLQSALPAVFQPALRNDHSILTQAYPLLHILCQQRDVVERLKIALDIPAAPSEQELAEQLPALCEKLAGNFNNNPLLYYRLPVVFSEFSVHSRVINQAIASFNQAIETYHAQNAETTIRDLHDEYDDLCLTLAAHAIYCDKVSLLQLLEMMAGWSQIPVQELFTHNAAAAEATPAEPEPEYPQQPPVAIIEQEAKPLPLQGNPFKMNYAYNFNGAGRIAVETVVSLLNAFGMKIGGHFDAEVIYSPRFLPIDQLHMLIRRQLSHRLEIPQSESFTLWLEYSIYQLGIQIIETNTTQDTLVNPFLTELLAFINPEKIRNVLQQALKEYPADDWQADKETLDMIAHFLFELLQGFQINPGQALGIGANWDGTITFSNEAGAYAFKFKAALSAWAKRFKELSLHRQGSSEALMNAMKGATFELQALLSSFDYMNQLQPSEYPEVIYNALIDNLVSDLLPEPPYDENKKYEKYSRQHVAKSGAGLQIVSYYVPDTNGTFFKNRSGQFKQTPMHRKAGTLEVIPFPRNTTCSEQSQASYNGNPLAPLRLQYMQALSRSVRGHVVYNPVGADYFLEDAFYGQVMRASNGDFTPFIGVVPHNFDRAFGQDEELCASFVMRMMLSSLLPIYCPVFSTNFEQIKTRFLPAKDATLPKLPDFCMPYLHEKEQALQTALQDPQRSFQTAEQCFYSLFKNVIYSLYELGKNDAHFQQIYFTYIHNKENFYPPSRAKCDKILRELQVNRPVYNDQELLARYDALLKYLRSVSLFFYPKPSEQLAQYIAAQARMHVKPLLHSPAMSAWFAQLARNKQSNFSRKQSPGMLFSALKDGGPSKTVYLDYKRMHGPNFQSHYHSPDGTPHAKPQLQDIMLDWGAKRVGILLQLLHKYNLLALLHYPLTEPYLHAKQRIAQHPQGNRFLWGLRGGVEGFFWHGLAKGFRDTLFTPLHMIFDLVTLPFHKPTKAQTNPMELPMAPANTPGIKALAAAQSRDILLDIVSEKSHDPDKKKDAVMRYVMDTLRQLYPQLPEEALLLCQQALTHDFALDDAEWQQLSEPLLLPEKNPSLSAFLHTNRRYINNTLLQAVFRCVTHNSEQTLKEAVTFFGLQAKQKAILADLLERYQRLPKDEQKDEQKEFAELFQFNGLLHKRLLARDRLIQKIQNSIFVVFDAQWVTTQSGQKQKLPAISDTMPSIKDIAQRRWLRFAEREWNHQLWNQEETEKTIADLEKKLAALKQCEAPLSALRQHTQTLDDPASLVAFYSSAQEIDDTIGRRLTEKAASSNEAYENARESLRAFVNTTMNALVNSCLDKVDIFHDELVNPLLQSQPMQTWLEKLAQNNDDLRSLLDQQVQQSASLDHALWRSNCIFQVLEQYNQKERIPHTSMQTILRFWLQHKNNVTSTGKTYACPVSGVEEACENPALFQSATMQRALKRTQEKLQVKPSALSIFRTLPQTEEPASPTLFQPAIMQHALNRTQEKIFTHTQPPPDDDISEILLDEEEEEEEEEAGMQQRF